MNAHLTCRIGISVALLATSALVTVPLGPVPFTLQTMILALLPIALGTKVAVRSVALYLVLVILYGIGAGNFYSKKHIRAKQRVKKYLRDITRLEKMSKKKEIYRP